MEGYSIAVFGDNHNSVYTFDKLMKMINDGNAAVVTKLKELEKEIDSARGATTGSQAERDAKALDLEQKYNETLKKRILFAVANGDLTISGNDVQYRMFLKQLGKLEVPVVTTPGNHDSRAGPNDDYRKIFGLRYYSFAVGDCDFIMLDDANQKRVEPAQMKWLEEELKRSEEYRYCFAFMHVPTFKGSRDKWDKAVKIPWSEYLSDRKNADELKKLFTTYEVDYVFGSHLHTFDFDMWDMDPKLIQEEKTLRSAQDEAIWTFVTGGGGAQLWKTYDARAVYHYFVGEINGRFPVADTSMTVTGTAFDRKEVKSPGGGSHYLMEKIWTYAFTDIYNNYLWEMLVLVGLLVVFITWWIVTRRRSRREIVSQGADDSETP